MKIVIKKSSRNQPYADSLRRSAFDRLNQESAQTDSIIRSSSRGRGELNESNPLNLTEAAPIGLALTAPIGQAGASNISAHLVEIDVRRLSNITERAKHQILVHTSCQTDITK